ncbi:hypothetical protein [Microcoleus sp. herbarium12]|uniref:hypothetical protein n=1 Tax=Microcoleus sp. herbarium12 TaxID=3055437 RepID=UPI002FD04319
MTVITSFSDLPNTAIIKSPIAPVTPYYSIRSPNFPNRHSNSPIASSEPKSVKRLQGKELTVITSFSDLPNTAIIKSPIAPVTSYCYIRSPNFPSSYSNSPITSSDPKSVKRLQGKELTVITSFSDLPNTAIIKSPIAPVTSYCYINDREFSSKII